MNEENTRVKGTDLHALKTFFRPGLGWERLLAVILKWRDINFINRLDR